MPCANVVVEVELGMLIDFLKLIKERAKLVQMDPALLTRSVNEGFSGGEKKRNEILQMSVLEPKLAILDETDSGLDIDALQSVASGNSALRGPDRAFVLVTHYQRLLNYVSPDYVHVLANGRIIKSGGKELALELEKKGYGWLEGAKHFWLESINDATRNDIGCLNIANDLKPWSIGAFGKRSVCCRSFQSQSPCGGDDFRRRFRDPH